MASEEVRIQPIAERVIVPQCVSCSYRQGIDCPYASIWDEGNCEWFDPHGKTRKEGHSGT